jgi:hypothetical protein
MKFTWLEILQIKIAAAYSGIWLQSYEPEDCLREIAKLCDEMNWLLYRWNLLDGMLAVVNKKWIPVEGTTRNLDQALLVFRTEEMARMTTKFDGQRPSMLLIVEHAEEYNSTAYCEHLRRAMVEGETEHQHILLMSHGTKVPEKIAKRVEVIRHPLPDEQQMLAMADEVVPEKDRPDDALFQQCLEAAAGLTRVEARNAFAEALILSDQAGFERYGGKLHPEPIWQAKSKILEVGTSAIQLYRGTESMADVGGYAQARKVLTNRIRPTRLPYAAKAKGSLMLGVPGSGKTLIMKALAAATGRPLLLFDPGKARGRYQGDAQQAITEVFDKARHMKAILGINEADKGLRGGEEGNLDAGVGAHIIKALLEFMEDPTTGVFTVMTANNIRSLVEGFPELFRSGRINDQWFLGLPSAKTREEIWKIHLRRCGFFVPQGIEARPKDGPDPSSPEDVEKAFQAFRKKPGLPEDDVWSGADIATCCENADLDGLSIKDAGGTINPTMLKARESVQWAMEYAISNHVLDADRPGFYKGPDADEKKMLKSFGVAVAENGSGPRRAMLRRSPPGAN